MEEMTILMFYRLAIINCLQSIIMLTCIIKVLQNANGLRVQRSIAQDPVRGNCRKKRELTQEALEEACEPLQKRRRKS